MFGESITTSEQCLGNIRVKSGGFGIGEQLQQLFQIRMHDAGGSVYKITHEWRDVPRAKPTDPDSF